MLYLVFFATDSVCGHTTFHRTEKAAQDFFRAFMIWSILGGDLDDNYRSVLETMEEDALLKLHKATGGFEGFYEPATLMSTTNLLECYEFLSGD